MINSWFTVEKIDKNTWTINEYCHPEETKWLSGEFPLSVEMIRRMVINHCDLPENYDIDTYTVFQGTPTRILKDGFRWLKEKGKLLHGSGTFDYGDWAVLL